MNCNVILDLLPLVKDGVASLESCNAVNDHIKTCESCRAECFSLETIKEEPIQDEKIIFKIKRSIFMTQIFVLIAGAIVGVALTNSMGMFYNFVIMPIIGGISFITFKGKSYLVAIAVFLLSYVCHITSSITLGGFNWYALYSGLFFSIIYTVLVGLGAVIAFLLKFSFRKEVIR